MLDGSLSVGTLEGARVDGTPTGRLDGSSGNRLNGIADGRVPGKAFGCLAIGIA